MKETNEMTALDSRSVIHHLALTDPIISEVLRRAREAGRSYQEMLEDLAITLGKMRRAVQAKTPSRC